MNGKGVNICIKFPNFSLIQSFCELCKHNLIFCVEFLDQTIQIMQQKHQMVIQFQFANTSSARRSWSVAGMMYLCHRTNVILFRKLSSFMMNLVRWNLNRVTAALKSPERTYLRQVFRFSHVFFLLSLSLNCYRERETEKCWNVVLLIII